MVASYRHSALNLGAMKDNWVDHPFTVPQLLGIDPVNVVNYSILLDVDNYKNRSVNTETTAEIPRKTSTVTHQLN